MNETLVVIIYALLIVFLIIAIIVGIKVLITLNKVNDILDDANEKLSALDKLFDIINFATDRMSTVTEIALGFITNGLDRLFKPSKKSRKSKMEEDEDE